jgi:2-aminoadipate transaminase
MRDLMAVTSRPEVISLAGGPPRHARVPAGPAGRAVGDVAAVHGPRALQYGPTEGLHELRQALADHMSRLGMVVGAGELIVTTGGQQAIDLVCRVLIDPGDPILAEGPTYPGAVPVFSAAGAEVHHVPWTPTACGSTRSSGRTTRWSPRGARRSCCTRSRPSTIRPASPCR